MKKIDAQALKAKHRLELVMQEFGEQFDINGDQWISKTTSGLVVNVGLQIYEYQKPGMDKESGDLFDWLKMRFARTFNRAVRFLEKRPLDLEQPLRDIQPEKAEAKILLLARHEWKYECKSPDEEKDSSGLYDRGLVDRGNGRVFYQYLLRPFDRLQARALEIGGEGIRECFTWEAREIDLLRRSQPSRFVPVIDMDIEMCDQCGEMINWWWKKEPQYILSETPSHGEIRFGSSFKKIRIYDNQQVFAFEYELDEESFCICESCMRKIINNREALSLLYKSARKRDASKLKETNMQGRNVLEA